MSDLAIEFGIDKSRLAEKKRKLHGNEISFIDISDSKLVEEYGKRAGIYYSVIDNGGDIVKSLNYCLNKLMPKTNGKILLAGLGNPSFVADALGNTVLNNVEAGSDLVKIYPNVSSVTGIDSTLMIKAVADLISPAVIIIIDTLCTLNVDRLCKVYQLTTAGISPGSGVGKNIGILDSASLGFPVIAIGVPLAVKMQIGNKRKLFTPVDIDAQLSEIAVNISCAVNQCITCRNSK